MNASLHLCISTCTCLFETNRGHLLRLRDLRIGLEEAYHAAVAQQCDGHHVGLPLGVQQKNDARFSLRQDSKRHRAESKRAVCTFDAPAGGMRAATRLVGWREAFQEQRVQHESHSRRPSTRACGVIDAVIHKCSRAAMQQPSQREDYCTVQYLYGRYESFGAPPLEHPPMHAAIT